MSSNGAAQVQGQMNKIHLAGAAPAQQEDDQEVEQRQHRGVDL